MRETVITIDGPAAAGKTTLAAGIAKTLDVGVLNSGLLYRAATWVMRERDLQEAAPEDLVLALEKADLAYDDSREGGGIKVAGRDISTQLQDPGLTRDIHLVADVPEVRRYMHVWQRRLCQGCWRVAEGRDQGSEVFPGAALKIYLDASPEVRLTRRHLQLKASGVTMDLGQLRDDMRRRDEGDRSRPMGALRLAEGARVLDSTNLNREEALEKALEWIKKDCPGMGG